jgi:hypothetical protein
MALVDIRWIFSFNDAAYYDVMNGLKKYEDG